MCIQSLLNCMYPIYQKIKHMSKHSEKYLHQHMNKKQGLIHSLKRTKIIATVGPACDTYEKLLSLVQAGVNVFRLNFSHGTHEDKLDVIGKIREIIKNEPYNICLLYTSRCV